MNMRGLPAIQYYVTGGQIDNIYQDLFGRAPDAGGKDWYSDVLADASYADAVAIIAGGAQNEDVQELADGIGDTTGGQYNTVADYVVDSAYGDVFDRSADPGGFDYYTQAIQSGMDPTTLDDQLARSQEAVSTLGQEGSQQAWEDATAFQNWNQMRIDYPEVYPLYEELRGSTGYVSPEELQLYGKAFGQEVSPEEREQFFRGALASGEITQEQLDRILGGEDVSTVIDYDTPTTAPAGTTSIVKPGTVVRTADQITLPSTGVMGLPAITMPQFLPVGGLATRATKPYAAGSTLQGPTGLFRTPTGYVGTPPTVVMPTATTPATEGAAPAEGMAEGGDVEAAGSRALTPAELGSKFNEGSYRDSQGRLISGYSRPIRDQFGTILGYEDQPYARNVVFGEALRGKEAGIQLSDADQERILRDLMIMRGQTGVGPSRGGLAGIEVRGPVQRNRPLYYPFESNYAKGGDVSTARELSAKGRGNDSMLVHMTPNEVAGLNALAMKYGGQLTINPETGLYEAGFLDKLFKAVAPLALGAFLGPGAFGIAGLGMSPLAAAATVGLGYTATTGSLAKGISAGLGAYGGANLASAYGSQAATAAAPGEATRQAAARAGSMAGGPAGVEIPTGIEAMGAETAGFGGAPPLPGEAAQLTTTDFMGGPDLSSTVPEVGLPEGARVKMGMGEYGYSAIPGLDPNIPAPATTPAPEIGYGTYMAAATPAIEQVQAAEAEKVNAQIGAAKAEDERRRKRALEVARRTLGQYPFYGASGGLAKLAGGGMTYMEAGGTTGPTGTPREVTGTGDGMSDSVPANIEGVQEARLADGEFVVPADVVSDIGNGSSDAGSKKLYDMMDRIRKARHGTTEQPPEINAERMMPA